MKPLSIKKRRLYLLFFALIFCVAIPLLILYSTGYRLTSALNLIRTGGLYISVPYSGANVFISPATSKQTGLFQKNVFVQNLRQGTYEVRVEKEGYQSWKKQLRVFPQTVTEAYSFLLPLEVETKEIPRFPSSLSTSTKIVQSKLKENKEYQDIKTLFSATSTSRIATSSDVLKVKRKLSIKNNNGVLAVSWLGDRESTPHYFCVNDQCKSEIIIREESRIRSFDFFPGRDDLIIITRSDGVFVTEIDDRSERNIQVLFKKVGADFRVKDGDSVYIKDGDTLFLVVF